MKKKFFSSLLMGALVATTLGTVTSCKDYDDDINNLQEQISKLATKDELSGKVSELQGLISTNSSAISSLQTAVAGKTTLDEVKAVLADYATKKYVDDADATLQAAIDALKTGDIAALRAAVAAAQEAADAADAKADANLAKVIEMLKEYATQEKVDAVQAIADAAKAKAEANAAALANAAKVLGAGFDETKTVAAAIEAINAQLGTADTQLADLTTRLAAVEAALNDAGDGSLTELAQKVLDVEKDLKDIIGEYTTMVTDVDLYVTNANDYRNGLPNKTLSFIFLDQEKTTKFPAVEGVADAQIEFSADNKNVTTTDSLVVRVSPTNAELSPANISLINSQGKEISDLVEVASVKPYKNLITTRAASQGNGLWMVTFKVKEGADAAKLAEEVAVKRGDKSYTVKYAVAVKNTASADTRRVVSAYEVNVIPEDYEPAKTDILVDNRDGVWFNIKDVHNRFYYENNNTFGAKSANEDGNPQEKAGIAEYKWKNEPQVAGTKSEMVLAGTDARIPKNLIDASVGKDININVASVLDITGQPVEDNNYVGTGNPNKGNATGAAIKGFYVTLDKDFAIESNPSEWNAWKKYSYTNVGIQSGDKYAKPAKLFTGKQGYISIDDEDAIGDIIGFRVYVVNLDGTLVDPDGRAFYVRVDHQKETADLTATALDATLEGNKTWNGSNYFSKNVELTEGVFDGTDYTDIADAIGYMEEGTGIHAGVWIIDVNPTAYGNNAVEPVYGTDYTITYVKKDGKTATTVPADAKYAKVNILNPQKFLDNGVYTAHTTLYRSNGTEVRTISVKFSKQMPTTIKALAWIEGFDNTKQVFTNCEWIDPGIYRLDRGSAVEAVRLFDKISDLTYGAADKYTSWYTLSYNDIANKHSVPATTPGHDLGYGGATDYILAVSKNDIDNKVHKIDYSYNFGAISLTFNYETAQYNKPETYVVNATKPLEMTFNSWIDFEKVKWHKSAPSILYVAGDGKYNQVSIPVAPYVEIQSTTKQKVNSGDLCWKLTTDAGVIPEAYEHKYYNLDGTDAGSIWYTENGLLNSSMKITKKEPVMYKENQQVTITPETSLNAWNTDVRNYVNTVSMFGESEEKPVSFVGLVGSYVNIESVTFAPASLYTVDLIGGNLVFTQQTYSANPTDKGKVTIKGTDCFGHAKTWELEVTIKH